MHTTTVRFDPETWELLKQRAEKLGIAKGDFIRIATVQRLERLSFESRLTAIERRLTKLEGAFNWVVARIRQRSATR